MTPIEYAQWYYLIYLVPGGTALLTLMLSMMGGGMRHHRMGHSAGHHGGFRHAGGGHRIAAPHHGAGGGHRVAAAHQGSHGGARHNTSRTSSSRIKATAGQSRSTIGEQMLALIGFGSIPSPFVWGSLLLGWSVFGFWSTRILETSLRHPALFILPSMAIAAGGAVVMAKLTTGILGRILPKDVSLAVSTVDLCGLTGKATFPVDEARGRVHVYDDHGTLHDCSARTNAGQGVISRGHEVLVVDYDQEKDQLIVEESA